MAVDNEYGPELQRRIKPLLTGVGPVEAAVVVTAELSSRQHRDELPRLVVSLGSAGSRRLEQGKVYQASAVAYRDMDASALGFEPGKTPFLELPAIIPMPLQMPAVPAATLSTGAGVVSGAAYERLAAEMVDMESYAVLRSCQRFGVPLLILRGISDGAEELHGIADWERYLHLVDARLAEAVDRLEALVDAGSFP